MEAADVYEDGTVLSTAQLDCRLLEGEIVVAHVKREHVLQAAWVILKVALYADDEAEAARRQLQRLNDPTAHAVEEGPAIAPMRALILDGDGATLVMGRRHWGLIRESGLAHLVEVAPHAWRAFEFNLGHMVAEVPGVVNHLAKLMADDNISVLHHSTYGSEIFLVQQRELAKAISCIRKKVDATLSFLLEQRSTSVPASTDSEGTPPPPESPLKATTASTATSSTSTSPASCSNNNHNNNPAEPAKKLSERLRIRQWQPTTTASSSSEPAPAPPLHHGHSHQVYDQQQHPQHPQAATPSHHVHHTNGHWLPQEAAAEQQQQQQTPPPPPPLSSSPFSLHHHHHGHAHSTPGAATTTTTTAAACCPQLVLRVMPKRLVLARIHKECLLECAGVLTRLFLFDQAPAAQFGGSSSGSGLHATRAGSSGGGRRGGTHHHHGYYQRERSGSLGSEEHAASAHASSGPRLIPRSAAAAGGGDTTPSSSALSAGGAGPLLMGGASPSPSIGISPELLGISPAFASRASSGGAAHHAATPLAAPYRGEADFGPLALIEMEGQEVTLLLPEEDVPLFPMGALVLCPLRWQPIKLAGRRFDFHETGVVSAMSKVDAGVPILNLSSFLTNVTLVRPVDLHSTLDILSEELDAAIDGLHTLGPLEEEEGEGEEDGGGGEEERRRLEQQQEREELVARMAGMGSTGSGRLLRV